MTRHVFPRLRAGLLVAAIALLSAGCMAAAVAGAGAAAGIHMTGNSASSTVQGSLAAVDTRAQAVLSEMGVTVQERTEAGNSLRYRGSAEGLEVNVELESQGAGATEVRASARRNPVEWDNAFARDLVQRIVQRS